ncbi:single-stranded DNA-binding protein [Capnocytophaga canimorsus]|uniref:single-stranded DNA-binding protein n=1 Tax=Capnocytophaga canimorsus TaxID=28188 RepID=UPI0037CF5276
MFLIMFSGYLTKDATFGTYGENSVLNFTVAVHFENSKKEEQRETVFYNCSRWYKHGDFGKLLSYMKKGQRVLVVGNRMNTVQNEKDGITYHNTQINVQSIELIGNNSNSQEQEEIVQ